MEKTGKNNTLKTSSCDLMLGQSFNKLEDDGDDDDAVACGSVFFKKISEHQAAESVKTHL